MCAITDASVKGLEGRAKFPESSPNCSEHMARNGRLPSSHVGMAATRLLTKKGLCLV